MSPARKASTWAGAIPLISVLGVAAAAGAIVSELRTMQGSIDTLTRKIDALSGETTRRLEALEQWRAAHEAAGEHRHY